MQNIIDAVTEAIGKAGLVEVETSARHVHLTEEDIKILFGPEGKLSPKRDLSQPGQFLSEERVNLIGPKSRKNNVAILGPARKATQVELSKSDCMSLGVKAPVRESGDVKGSGSIIIEGPCGQIEIPEGVMIAKAHIHVIPEVAKLLELKDKQIVQVEVLSDRPIIFKNVVIRVSDRFRYRMHIDVDEANAAGVQGFTLGRIIK